MTPRSSMSSRPTSTPILRERPPDLAKKTGAKIVYGPTAKPGFEAIVAEDGQVFEVGGAKVKRSTPRSHDGEHLLPADR